MLLLAERDPMLGYYWDPYLPWKVKADFVYIMRGKLRSLHAVSFVLLIGIPWLHTNFLIRRSTRIACYTLQTPGKI